MRHTVFIACLLCVTIAGSQAASIVLTGILSYSGLAVTSNGDGNQTTLSAINACDTSQQWTYDSDGFIYQSSNTTLVLDVQNSDVKNGAPVIMWNKKTPNSPNQLWDVTSTGVVSRLNGYYLRKSSTSYNVVNSNNQPPHKFEFVKNPYPCPASCVSHGDPHFTTWTGRRYDFQSANTVLLANFSGTKIYSVQFSCAPGVTCNEGMVVQPAGTTDTFQITGTKYLFYNKNATAMQSGTTAYGNYFNFTKVTNTAFTLTIPSAMLTFSAYQWVYGTYIDITVTLRSVVSVGASLCVGPVSGQDQHAYGSQFVVVNKGDTAYQYVVTPFSYNPNYVPNYGPYVTNDTALMQNATNACAVITSASGYGACNSLVDPTFYQGTCYNDTIALGCVCAAQPSIDAYAFLCTMANSSLMLPTSPTTSVIVNVVTVITSYTTTNFTIIAKDINNKNRTTGGDNFTVTITIIGTSTTVAFNLTDNNDGTYTVVYTTVMEGIYVISVKLTGNDVSNSPINVTVIASTSASTTGLVLGPVPPGQTSCFTIQARSASGVNRSVGGDTFAVTSSSSSLAIIGTTDNGDGTYTICYNPSNTGYYTIDVKYQGQSIACSPFTVLVKGASP